MFGRELVGSALLSIDSDEVDADGDADWLAEALLPDDAAAAGFFLSLHPAMSANEAMAAAANTARRRTDGAERAGAGKISFLCRG